MADLKEKSISLMSTTTGIDATSVATTTLYTVPAGKTFIPMFVVIRVTAYTKGTKNTEATASFGGNSATYDDFLNSVQYAVANANYFQTDGPTDDTAVPVQSAGSEFKVSVEVGSNADVETWAVDLFGYLV